MSGPAPGFIDNNRKPAQSYETSYTNWYNEGIVEFRPNFHNQEAMTSDDHSGESSPPLWKSSPSPPKSPSQPLLGRRNHHRSLSPDSRAQAIAKGQWELMEMVKNMPESSYELTLKDLVESHQRVEKTVTGPLETERRLVSVNNRNQGLHQRAKVKRQESFKNRGLFLNMAFPFSFKSRKKRDFSASGKVSPRPEGLKGGGGAGEKDWWKKRFTGSSDSDSSRISGSSAGSSGSSGSSGVNSNGSSRSAGGKRNGLLSGCWSCFKSRKSKSVE